MLQRHFYNSSTGKYERGKPEFKSSLKCRTRPWLKANKQANPTAVLMEQFSESTYSLSGPSIPFPLLYHMLGKLQYPVLGLAAKAEEFWWCYV